jgi:hypothetical protein
VERRRDRRDVLAAAGSVIWEGETARLADPEERIQWMLAEPVFRVRFGAQWPCDPVHTDDSDDEEE